MFHSTLTMKAAFVLILLLHESRSKSLEVGSTLNGTLTYMEVSYNDGVPMMSREDDIHFSDPTKEYIKGIKVQDLGETSADIATITGGGVGHNFVNISLKSAPGDSLNYQIEIYS